MRIVVIGAGILGASAAWHLAREGHSVTVLDAEHPGKATMAGAGIVCPWATKAAVQDEEWYALYAAGARYYAQLVADLSAGGETQLGYRKVGALVVADDAAEFDAAGERLARRTAEAPESGGFERLSAAAARELFPPLRGNLDAWHIPGAARVDARLLAAAMLRRAVAAGAQIVADLATLEQAGDGIRVRDGQGREVPADRVILTGGAWASRALAPLGLAHPVVPQKGQIVHLGLPGIDTSRWPVLLPMASHYLLAFDDSRVVIGATREEGSGFDTRVTAGGQAEVLNAALHWAPGLRDAVHIETRVGLRPAPPTIRPILGPAPRIEGLFLGNGLGAGGLTIGPWAGRQLARLATGAETETSLAPYAPAA